MLLFTLIHQTIWCLLLVQVFFIFKKYLFGHFETVLLFTLRTTDIMYLFWVVGEIVFVDKTFFWRFFDSAFAVWAVYRLAKDNYPDDDDDTYGKRAKRWVKNHLPKPYVKPVPVPV